MHVAGRDRFVAGSNVVGAFSKAMRAAIVATVIAWAGTARAGEPRPSWECLPDDTAAMLRLPAPTRFVEELRARTKFGAVLLEGDRARAALRLLFDASGTGGDGLDIDAWERSLGRYGLGPADAAAVCAGECGAGVVIRPRAGDGPPLVMVLVWMEPGPETAERLLAAARQVLEEAEGVAAPRRTDVELAGAEVVWTVAPILQPDLSGLDIDEALGEEGLGALRRKIAERVRTMPPVEVGQEHGFVTRLGGRLLAGRTFSTGPDAAGLERGVGQERPRLRAPTAVSEAEAEAIAEEARLLAARFIAAHHDDGESAIATILQAPGCRDALPAGMPVAEAVLDPQVLVRAVGSDPAAWQGLAAESGVARLGPVAWRLSLEGDRLRQGLFATLPAPRTGLFRVLDQDCDPAAIPPFALGDVVDLTQVSLDLGGAYRILREVVASGGDEQAANLLTAAEMQVFGWLGVELPQLLSSLGSRHWVMSYPPRVAEAIAEARQRRADGPLDALPAADRTTLVWQVADEAPFAKLLERAAALAAVEFREEQGFRGVRLPAGAAAFVGHGHLVLASGPAALDQTLAGIRSPPSGAAALRDRDLFRKADEMLALGPARLFSVGDSIHTGGMLGTLRDVAAELRPSDVPPAQRRLLERLQAILPAKAEMEGMFGAGGSIVEMTADGVVMRAACEMPPP
jgi:hypothetical protein